MTATPVTIRPARPQDMKAMVDILGQLFAIEQDFDFHPARHRAGLDLLMGDNPGSLLLVAEIQGEVAGMGSCQLTVSTAEGALSGLIEDVVVAEGKRGGGVGSAIVAALAEWAASKGATRLCLLADRDNQPALDFYHSRGFGPTNLICLRRLGVGPSSTEAI